MDSPGGAVAREVKSRSVRRLACLLALLVTCLLLVPAGAAQAAHRPVRHAQPNPWLAYFPATGVTCTSVATDPEDGSTISTTTTIVAKSAKKVVVRETGSGVFTALLLPHGRMRQLMKGTQKVGGIRQRFSMIENYPSPAAAVAHGSATGRLTLTMPLGPRQAKSVLTSGSVLTVSAKARAVGVGSRVVTLADPAATTVQAIGVRSSVGSVRLSSNAKPAFARFMKRFMGTLLRSMSGTDWFAQGRGDVLSEFSFGDVALTSTQTGCS